MTGKELIERYKKLEAQKDELWDELKNQKDALTPSRILEYAEVVKQMEKIEKTEYQQYAVRRDGGLAQPSI